MDLPAWGRLHVPRPTLAPFPGTHGPLSLTACSLGRGAAPTFLFRFHGFSKIGPEGQSWSPEPLRIPIIQPLGLYWTSFLPCSPTCPLGSCHGREIG